MKKDTKERSLDQSCLNAAYRYLAYRPRSELEIKTYLRQKGVEARSIESALDRLKEQGLVDDLAFARFWKENRESFSPRGQARLGKELREKGIKAEVIAEVVGEMDEESNAYKAAQKKARLFESSDYSVFRNKLSSFLRQRGFNWGVTQRTINRLWQESKNA